MSTVAIEYVNDEQLIQEQQAILSDIGLTLAQLRAKDADYSYTVAERDAYDRLVEINFLLND